MAAVSVLLYSGDEQLQVRGPIQISLPLGDGTHLRAADTLPAWTLNLRTGETEDEELCDITTELQLKVVVLLLFGLWGL